MGKKRIAQLLDQLHENHQADVENSATIFTVAQVAVNHLAAASDQIQPNLPILPPARLVNREELKRRYGSFNACRTAAKQAGIRFSGHATWDQLEAAFSYFESLQNLIQSYMDSHPNPKLQGVSMEFKL